jgi:hypothetical protein
MCHCLEVRNRTNEPGDWNTHNAGTQNMKVSAARKKLTLQRSREFSREGGRPILKMAERRAPREKIQLLEHASNTVLLNIERWSIRGINPLGLAIYILLVLNFENGSLGYWLDISSIW